MKRLFVLIAVLSLCSAANAAEPNAVPYQLQERCGKRAEEALRASGWIPAKDLASIQSHYNSRLNRCFAIQRTMINGDPNVNLFDVNEGKDYGEFILSHVQYKGELTLIVTECYVEKKHCRSAEEWEELARPYMEE
jgi:hypothetical protein